MKRLIRKASFNENQVKDAVNKAIHFTNLQKSSVENAQNILGKNQANSYLIALILTYNGMENELETTLNNFLYNGQMDPNVYNKAQDVVEDWEDYLDEF